MKHKNLIFLSIYLFLQSFLFGFGEVVVDGSTKTGYLLGGKTSGVDYSCNNESLNKTDINGTFYYKNDCNITFSLNNQVILGSIKANKIPADYKLYLTDFVGDNRLDTANQYVTNLASVLQSLDRDRDDLNRSTKLNGIEINSSDINYGTINIGDFTSSDTLENDILKQQYPNRSLISDDCAMEYVEEILREDGFYVDNFPPCKPILVYPDEINATSNNITYIDLIGEKNSKIFLNGIDTNKTINRYGKYYEFPLQATLRRNTFNTYNITLVDNTGKSSEPLVLRIFNDTDQPFIVDENITMSKASSFSFTTIDDSLQNGLSVKYEIFGGIDSDKFKINNQNKLEFIGNFIGAFNITIKVIDKANHYDTKNIIVNVVN